jgi:hypothetical protein
MQGEGQICLPVYDGVALKIYKINRWVPGGSALYKTTFTQVNIPKNAGSL